jgi:hypothetical protein
MLMFCAVSFVAPSLLISEEENLRVYLTRAFSSFSSGYLANLTTRGTSDSGGGGGARRDRIILSFVDGRAKLVVISARRMHVAVVIEVVPLRRSA